MSARAAAEWQRRAEAEYASAALAAELLHRLFIVGASPDVLLEGHRVVGDEIEHAVLSHGIAARLSATARPIEESVLKLPWTAGKSDLANVVAFAVDFFCCSESVARPLFLEMATRAVDEEARFVLERIQRDESRHGAYGFFIVDDLLPRVSPADVEWLKQRARESVERVRRLYAGQEGVAVSDADAALGLVDARRMADITDAELKRRVEPQLRERGLLV